MDGNDTNTANKGFGLKKWRRIRRDGGGKEAAAATSSSGLKRLLPTAAPAESETSSKSSTAASAPKPIKPNKPQALKGKKPRGRRQDPLDPLLLDLESLQQALAREVDKLGQIGVDPVIQYVDHHDDDELDCLFKQRLEAEIECLAITETWKLVAGKQATLFTELKSAAHEQPKVLSNLGETRSKAAKLEKDLVGNQHTLVTRTRIYKVTCCFFVQLILFIFVLWISVSRLSRDPASPVPT